MLEATGKRFANDDKYFETKYLANKHGGADVRYCSNSMADRRRNIYSPRGKMRFKRDEKFILPTFDWLMKTR